MKVHKNNRLNFKLTLVVNTKQWLYDNGGRIASDIDRFFTTQAGSRKR